MAWNFCKGKSISSQIADRIAVDVLSGAILPSQRLPYAEEMSKITGASVFVVKEAYNELLREGIVTGELYILSSDLTPARARRDRLARNAVTGFISELSDLGLTRTEMLQLFGSTVIEKSKSAESVSDSAQD